MKNKKGFTLIELLAVIVIIGVIALIVVPNIKGLIKKSEEQTDMLSVKNYYNAADLYYNEAKGNKAMYNKLDSNVISELDVDGPKASGGELYLSKSGKQKIALIFNDRCYTLDLGVSLDYIQVSDDVTNCVAYTPSSFFMYRHNDTDTGIIIIGYKKGGYMEQEALSEPLANKINKDYTADRLVILNMKYVPGEVEDVHIPPVIDGLPVVAIGDNAFASNYHDGHMILKNNKQFNNIPKASMISEEYNPEEDKLYNNPTPVSKYSIISSITLPDTITSIGTFAFSDNKLSEITLPSGLKKLASGAFAYSNFDSIDVPESVTDMGIGVFMNARATSITLPSTITSIPNYTFKHSNISSFDIKNTVTSLGIDTFRDSEINSITIPGTIDVISDTAFYESNLSSLTISEGVKEIGESAFAECNLTSVTIPSTVTTIRDSAFRQNHLTSIIIPDTVTTLEDCVFENNNITTAKLPSGLTKIPSYLFYQNRLTSIDIPSGVKTIGDNSFYHNYIENLVIPGTIKNIGDNAFASNQLTSLTLSEGIKTIGRNAFAINQISTTTIPNSLTELGSWAFDNNAITLNINNTPVFNANYPWNIAESNINYLHGVTITADDSIKNNISYYPFLLTGKTAYNQTLSLVYNDPFKTISSVTVDGVVHTGNSFTTLGTDGTMNISAVTTTDVDTATVETPHPYENKKTYTWNLSDTTVKSYTITFSSDSETESNYDYVRIYNGTNGSGTKLQEYSGTQMSGQTYTLTGTTGSITLVTDEAVVANGLKFTIQKNR